MKKKNPHIEKTLIDDATPSNINIKDVIINVFGDDGTPMGCVSNWRVDVMHNPTGIVISESSQKGIHRNRVLAMQRLSWR